MTFLLFALAFILNDEFGVLSETLTAGRLIAANVCCARMIERGNHARSSRARHAPWHWHFPALPQYMVELFLHVIVAGVSGLRRVKQAQIIVIHGKSTPAVPHLHARASALCSISQKFTILP